MYTGLLIFDLYLFYINYKNKSYKWCIIFAFLIGLLFSKIVIKY